MEALKEKRVLDRETRNKVNFMTFIIAKFVHAYKMSKPTAEMRNSGYRINHKTVQKLMDISDLKCKIRKVRYRSYRRVKPDNYPGVPEDAVQKVLSNLFCDPFAYRRDTDIDKFIYEFISFCSQK